MIDEQPMLRATALLAAVGLVGVSLAGWGSFELTVAVALSLLNLFAMATLCRLTVQAAREGGPAALGLLVMNGKTLILLCALVALGSFTSFTPVVLGFAWVTICFTLAAPLVAVAQAPRPVEVS